MTKIEMKSNNNLTTPQLKQKLSEAPDKRVKVSKVVWAIDPMEENSRVLQKMERILKLWSPSSETIKAVSVLSPIDLGWPAPLSQEMEKELLSRAQEKSSRMLKKTNYPSKNTEIILSSHLSLLSAVQKLLAFSKKQKAEIIALYSRTGQQLSRLGFGSFAEIAIATSKTPVLVVGDQTKVPQAMTKILFPTDFSAPRKKAFELTIDWAIRHNAEIILYHQFGMPLTPVALSSSGLGMDAFWFEAAWAQNEKFEKMQNKKWAREAQKKGARCRVISELSQKPWSQRLLEIGQNEKVDLMVIPVRRGVWGQALFGRKIRKLFSQATCPLIFVHSEK